MKNDLNPVQKEHSRSSNEKTPAVYWNMKNVTGWLYAAIMIPIAWMLMLRDTLTGIGFLSFHSTFTLQIRTTAALISEVR